MRRFLAALVVAGTGIAGLAACHSTSPITVCSETKPVSGVSLRGASSSGGVAVCDGVTSTHHYFWHIRYDNHARTYYHVVAR